MRYVPLNFGLPKDLWTQLQNFPICSSRALCSVAFAEAAQANGGIYEDLSDEAFKPLLRDAYMRAALGEFVSIEDLIYAEMRSDKINREAISIYASKKLLPIIFKEIRNLSFHISSPRSEEVRATVKVRFEHNDTHTSPLSLPIRILEFDQEEFIKLRNVQATSGSRASIFWRDNDIGKALAQFGEQQRQVGIHRLFNVAVVEYLNFLIGKIHPVREREP